MDEVSAEFRSLWDRMGLTYDKFIRTTDEQHVRGVQAMFKLLQDRGYIYKSKYSGQYCVYDELYVEVDTPGAPCPLCGRTTETVEEENYFFKLSAMEEPLLKLYELRARFHPSGDSAQRSDLVRAWRTERSFDQPHDVQVGHPRAGRRGTRHLRLARRVVQLHHRPRLR